MDLSRREAILLVGPTGSGKTPLGRLLERRGLRGRRCHHFDFGEELRRVAAMTAPEPPFTSADVALARRVLDQGALLEDEDFHVAERALRAFLEQRDVGEGDLVVLNGMPRHVGQAEAVDRMLAVAEVVRLSCPAEVVLRRIADDTGGDRAGRIDDGAGRVRSKLQLFRERTEPLVERYRACGARVRTYAIGTETRAEDLVARLEEDREC